MRSRLADDARWRVWVLDHAGDVVGNVWLQLVEKLPNPNVDRERHGYITNFYVRPEHRNGGAGSRMLRAVLDECERSDVDTVFLWPTARSRPLYERHGFMPGSGILAQDL
jgi:GNAT superfamily N-acetyltransferase